MANRSDHELKCIHTQTVCLNARLTGGGAAGALTPVAATLEDKNGEIVSAVNTGTGKWTLTFRHSYPQLRAAPICSFVGTTDGLVGQCASIDVVTKTAALEVYVGSTPTDLATTDEISLTWFVRNSNKN